LIVIVGGKTHEIKDEAVLDNRFELVPFGPALVRPDHIPSIRTARVNADGVQFNYLITATGGGLGDTICAEPTVRYFIQEFKRKYPDEVKVSVLTRFPEIFRHLKDDLENIFEVGKCELNHRDYNVLATAVGDKDFLWEFLNMGFMHCLDAPSMCSMGRQLPKAFQELKLVPNEQEQNSVLNILSNNGHLNYHWVVLHPGRTWPSRTLPADYWNEVIKGLIANDIKPIIIGAQCENGNSTVEVNAEGCIDLRNQLSMMETVFLVQNAKVVVTNDSAPLHMAASGKSWIGFFGTARHPDFITYQRAGIFGHKMKNLAISGMWDTMDLRPGLNDPSRYDKIDEETLRSWLPPTADVVSWINEVIER